jgi:hypothetical protein
MPIHAMWRRDSRAAATGESICNSCNGCSCCGKHAIAASTDLQLLQYATPQQLMQLQQQGEPGCVIRRGRGIWQRQIASAIQQLQEQCKRCNSCNSCSASAMQLLHCKASWRIKCAVRCVVGGRWCDKTDSAVTHTTAISGDESATPGDAAATADAPIP